MLCLNISACSSVASSCLSDASLLPKSFVLRLRSPLCLIKFVEIALITVVSVCVCVSWCAFIWKLFVGLKICIRHHTHTHSYTQTLAAHTPFVRVPIFSCSPRRNLIHNSVRCRMQMSCNWSWSPSRLGIDKKKQLKLAAQPLLGSAASLALFEPPFFGKRTRASECEHVD